MEGLAFVAAQLALGSCRTQSRRQTQSACKILKARRRRSPINNNCVVMTPLVAVCAFAVPAVCRRVMVLLDSQ